MGEAYFYQEKRKEDITPEPFFNAEESKVV
jgi:hypothetical protein